VDSFQPGMRTALQIEKLTKITSGIIEIAKSFNIALSLDSKIQRKVVSNFNVLLREQQPEYSPLVNNPLSTDLLPLLLYYQLSRAGYFANGS
jgi:hypothetical protein